MGVCALLVGLGVLAFVSAWFLAKSYPSGQAQLPPSNQSATPAGNGFATVPQQLWPLGFQTSAVQSIDVSYSLLDGYQMEGNVSFYQEECSTMTVDQVFLRPIRTNLLTLTYTRSPANYLRNDYPLYVSGGNSSLKYIVMATSTILSNETTDCALQMYLYNNSSSYSLFKDGLTPEAPFADYVAKSGCLALGHSGKPETSTVHFNLSNASLYYVGVAMYANVNLTFDISGTILEYNVSKLKPDECSLSPTVESCTIHISSPPHNVCVLYESDNPFGTLELYFDTQTTPWKAQFVICLVFLLVDVLILFAILTTGTIIFFCRCCKKWKNNSRRYQQVDGAPASSEESCGNKPDERVL